MIVAHGSRFGGHALYVKDGKVRYTYNFLGIDEKHFTADLPSPGKHIVGVEFTREGTDEDQQGVGTTELYVDDEQADEGPMRAIGVQFSLCGEGLTVGYDGGDRVTTDYPHRFEFTNGEIIQVVFDVAGGTYADAENQLTALMARD